MDANKEIWFFRTLLTNSLLMSNIRSSNSVPLKDKGVTVIFSSTLLSTFKIHETCFSGFFLPRRLSQQTKQKRNVKIFPMTLKIQTICSHTKTNRNFQKLEQIWCKWRKKGQILLCGIFCKWETPLSQIMCSEKPKMVHIFVLRLVNWTHVN